ncbi:PAS domain-containing protein [Pseudoalteromonas ulvae]|uniref:PAS domain-containing protein n=1 Tax=Pseudoalteromonas ulvae TaxID=107327 RepID=UPI00186B825C|nr:PAS domain-containing protein [Pseudoalteromonas ulvae]
MTITVKPGTYFKLTIALIIILGSFAMAANWYIEERASALLFQNLEEVHRSQKASYEYLETKKEMALLALAYANQDQKQVVKYRDITRLKIRSLRKELNLWRYAVEADLSLATDFVREAEQEELDELIELSELVVALQQNTNLLLAKTTTSELTFEQFNDSFVQWTEENKPLDVAFSELVRETKAENYLELDEFGEKLKLAKQGDVILLVCTVLIAGLFAYLERRTTSAPLQKISNFLLSLRNQQARELDLSAYGNFYHRLEQRLKAVISYLENEKLQHQDEIKRLQHSVNDLHQQQEINGFVLDNIAEAVIKTNLSGEIIFYNRAFESLLRGTKIALIRNIQSIVILRLPSGELLQFEQFIKEVAALSEQKAQKHLLLDTTSGQLQVEVSIQLLDSGVLLTVADASVVHLQKAQDNLLHSLYESFEQPIWLLDQNWNVLDLNSYACKQFDKEKQQFVGFRMPMIDLLLTKQLDYQSITQSLEEHGVWTGQLLDYSKDYQTVQVDVEIKKLATPSSLGVFFVTVKSKD